MNIHMKNGGSETTSNLKIPLLVIATAQLMLVLDDSIANIALPTIQNELDISASFLPWVINAYILAFGGLLLFCGRVGDLFGRKKTLQIGILIFTVASLVAGIAINSEMLIIARGLQGVGAALTAPNALALIATTFPAGKPRNSAMATYGAMSGIGIVAGLLLGGLLTGLVGWRWVFYINIPIGLAVLVGTKTLVDAKRHSGKLDFIGAFTSVAGMVALTYAITSGGEHGWTNSYTLGAFAAAAIMLSIFILSQSRITEPMLPLRLFKDRNRVGSYLSMLLLAFGPMGTFYLLTLFMQHILQYSPVETGLSWLPFGIGIVLSAGIASKLVSRFSPRLIASVGMLIGAAAALWLAGISDSSAYYSFLLPGIFFTAFGFGMGVISLTLTAVSGIPAQDSGIASALLNASQQIGVAMGLAVLSSVSVGITSTKVSDALTSLYQGRESGNHALVQNASEAIVSGYSGGLIVGGIALFIAAVIAFSLIHAKKHDATER